MTKKNATVLNDFFSNIITNIGIPQYIEGEPDNHDNPDNIDDQLMKAIIKYRLHPSIITKKEKCLKFLFSFLLS